MDEHASTLLMPRKPRSPFPPGVTAEIPKRLHNAAEAFYFAAILSSARFNAGAGVPNRHYTVERALDGIAVSRRKANQVDAPPLVNFAFAIELYIKPLRFLSDRKLIDGHDLYDLFVELDRAAPNVGTSVIQNHRHARGEKEIFLKYVEEARSVFEHWRYAHEKTLLIAAPDSLLALADAFRATIRELYPDQRSVFETTPEAG